MRSIVYHDACLSYQMIIKTGTTSYALLHHHCFNVLTDTDLPNYGPRAKSSRRSNFAGPRKHFANN